MESMDGHLGIPKYYELSDDESCANAIKGLKFRSEPFSVEGLKSCPMCRAPLRSIKRYGRIVQRAFIDEATKKFIVWPNAEFVPLVQRLEVCETELRNSTLGTESLENPTGGPSFPEPIILKGSGTEQMKVVSRNVSSNHEVRKCLNLLRDIKEFLRKMDENEQPFRRVYSLMEDAHRCHGITTGETELHRNPRILQVGRRLLTALLLRCEYAILTKSLALAYGKVRVDFQRNRWYCSELSEECEQREKPRRHVEALLYWARFAVLERTSNHPGEPSGGLGLRTQATEYLSKARMVCEEYPGQTKGLLNEIEATEDMIGSSTFYLPVSNEERAAVVAAMTQEFLGTGNWNYCQNGHPFKTGECGMPMQSSRCPECGSPVGGQNHDFVEVVTEASDMDEGFSQLAIGQ